MCTRSIATLLTLALAAATLPIQAQDAADSNEVAPPIVIDADSNYLDLRAGVNRFQDNVSITRGSMQVHADSGVVRQVDGQISTVELEGAPATWRDRLDDGSLVSGESRSIHFDVQANVVTLTGNAVIRHAQGEFTGDELVYDLNAESLAGRSTGNDRVRVVIEPDAIPNGAPETTPDSLNPPSVEPEAGDPAADAPTSIADDTTTEGSTTQDPPTDEPPVDGEGPDAG